MTAAAARGAAERSGSSNRNACRWQAYQKSWPPYLDFYLLDLWFPLGYNGENRVRSYSMANVIEITSFDDPRLDVYARLTEAQLLNRFEPAKGMFIV